MTLKLCVFPNDPILSYYDKGEIKEGYFNPKNYFDEIHIISLFHSDIAANKIQSLAGSGELIMHVAGKVNLLNYKSFEPKITNLVSNIKPNMIRSYNNLLGGWLAVKASKSLSIPLVTSLHTNHDQNRRSFKAKHFLPKIERFVLENSSAVICVYNFITEYARSMGAENIHLIYNKIDPRIFKPDTSSLPAPTPIILSIGRLIQEKNHKFLIEAMQGIKAKLIIIGDGPNLNALESLIKIRGLDYKIQIIKKIPNSQLPQYYQSATIYAQPMENLGGIPIPVLEAMACGLPVVMSKHFGEYNEVIDNAVHYVDNNPTSFRSAFQKIISDKNYHNELSVKSLSVIKEMGDMEQKEALLYDGFFKNKLFPQTTK